MDFKRYMSIVPAVLLLSACDNTPTTNFEQTLKDRQAANAGDRYASLEGSLPRQSNYIRQKQELQRDYAAGQSGTFRATYDSLISQLEADKKIDRTTALFMECRAAFREASAYQSDSSSDVVATAPTRMRVLAELKVCRSDAQEAKKGGGDAGDTAILLSRFASTGLVMIGVKVVGQGDAHEGLKIWTEGEKLVAQDKPGFKITLQTFQ